MKKQKSGLAHLCHHDRHWEFCYDFDKRIRFIKKYKPEDEIETRLKYFKIIPNNILPGGDSPKWDAYDKAGAAFDRAWAAWAAFDRAWAAWAAFDRAGAAWAAFDRAGAAYLAKYKLELDKLHDKLFPDCPWNGNTMFPNGQGGDKVR